MGMDAIEERVLIHYGEHSNIADEWLFIEIPANRASFAKEIVELIKSSLEKPMTYKEKDEGHGCISTIIDNRLKTVKGITDCGFTRMKSVNTVINIPFKEEFL